MKDPIMDEIHKHHEEIIKKHGSFQAYQQSVMETPKAIRFPLGIFVHKKNSNGKP